MFQSSRLVLKLESRSVIKIAVDNRLANGSWLKELQVNLVLLETVFKCRQY